MNKPDWILGNKFRQSLTALLKSKFNEILTITKQPELDLGIKKQMIDVVVHDIKDTMDRSSLHLATNFIASVERSCVRKVNVFINKARETENLLIEQGYKEQFGKAEALDVIPVLIQENVGLIKSIPQKYHTQIETLVNQAILYEKPSTDLASDIHKLNQSTFKRAKFIARDQLAKANTLIQNERVKKLGITQAIWRHSHAGKHPRLSHVKADGTIFDIEKGCLIDGEYIQSGEKINCRCYSEYVIE